MKEGWTYKKLGEIATEMYRGSGIKRDQVTKEGTPCVRYGEIYTTYNISFNTCVSHTSIQNIASPKYFEHGDLLFAITGESVEDIGKTIAYLGNDKCLCGGDIICMKHRQNPKYLAYALSTPEAIRQKGIGKTKLKVVHTNAPALKAISIPLAPLSEQQSIVDYLDSAFAKIDAMKANAEKALNEAKALFQASLKEMLEPKEGWVTSTLKDECFKITDGTHQTPKYYQSGYIFLSSKNVTSRKIDWANVKFIDESQHQIMYKRVAPQVGDILLAKNGTTGVAAMVDRDVVFDIYVSLALLRTKGNVTPEYLLTFVNSPIAKEQFDKRLIGMGVPNLHLGEINKVVITYPIDKEEQAKVTEKMEELDNKIICLQENYNKISQECDALKQAILRQVFE